MNFNPAYSTEAQSEKIKKEIHKLYDFSYEDIVNESLECLPLYKNLKPEEFRYEEQTLIASGGMKDIFKVFDPKVGRHIALARLRRDSPEELYEPFLREAYLTSQLDHPNIITIFDIALDENLQPYFTMELKTGQTFDELINKVHKSSKATREEIHELLEIFSRVCDAVDYAHDKGIVHLDLKPKNIQVGSHGEVIVCDWGLAKVLSEEGSVKSEIADLLLNPDLINSKTVNGLIKGTPGYMAPEQIDQKGEKTKSTDIYSLGAILFKIITGDLAVNGKNLDELLKNTIEGKISNSYLTENISESLSSITLKALALKPEERFASVNSMKEDLRRYLGGFSTSAEIAGFAKEARLFYQRNKLPCNMFLAFSLVIAAIILGSVLLLSKSQSEAVIAKEKLQQEINNKEQLGKEAAPKYCEKALASLLESDFATALENVNTAILLDSSDSRSMNVKAFIHFIQGEYDLAESSFREPLDTALTALKKVNNSFLNNENELIKDTKIKNLLKVGKTAEDGELTIALYLHFFIYKEGQYRHKVISAMSENCLDKVLTFASKTKDLKLREELVKNITSTINQFR